MNKDIKQQLLFDQNIPDEQKQAILAQRKMLGGIIKKDQPLHKNIISVLIFIIVIPFILLSELYEAICYYTPKIYDFSKRISLKFIYLTMKGIQNIYNFIIFVIENRQQLYQSFRELIFSVLRLFRVFWYKIYSILLRITDLRLILYARIYKIFYFFYQLAIKPIAHFLNKNLSYLFNGIGMIIMKNKHFIATFFKKIHRALTLLLETIMDILEFIVIKLYYFSKSLIDTSIQLYQLTITKIQALLRFLQKFILIPIKNGLVNTYEFLVDILIIKPRNFYNWICHKISVFKKKVQAYIIQQTDKLINGTVNLFKRILQKIIDFVEWLGQTIKAFGKYLWDIQVNTTKQIKQLAKSGFKKFISDPAIFLVTTLIYYSKLVSIYIANQIVKCKELLLYSLLLIKDKVKQMIYYVLNKLKQGFKIILNKTVSPLLEISKDIGKYILRQIKTCLIYIWGVLVYKKNQIKQLTKAGYTKFLDLCTIILKYCIKALIFCFNQITKYYEIFKKYIIKLILILKDKVSNIVHYLIIEIRNGFLLILNNVILPLLHKIQQIINYLNTLIYNTLVSLQKFITEKLNQLLNNLLKFMNYTLVFTQKIYRKTKYLIINIYLIPLLIKIQSFGITIFNSFLRALKYIRYQILRPKINALKKFIIRIAIYCLDQFLRFLVYFQSIKEELKQTIKSILFNITIRPIWWLLKLLWKLTCIVARSIKLLSIRVYSIIKKTHHLVVITALSIKLFSQKLLKNAIIQIKAIYQKESQFYLKYIRPRIQQVILISKELIVYLITNYGRFKDQTKLIVKKYYEIATVQFKIIYGILRQETIRITKILYQNIKEFISIMVINSKKLKAQIQQIWMTTSIFLKQQKQLLIANLKIFKENIQNFLIEIKRIIKEISRSIKAQISQFYAIAKQNMIILRDLIQSFKNKMQKQFQIINESLIKPIVENMKQQSLAIKLYVIQTKDSVKGILQSIQQSSRQMKESMKQQLLEQKQMLRDKKNQLKADLREFKRSFKRV